MKRVLIGVLLGAALMGAAWLLVDAGRPPVESLPPGIREKIITETVVKEIPGPPTVIERIKWKTREVPVDRPVVQEVTRVIERAAEVGSLFAQVEVTGDKHLGRDGDKLVVGWIGNASCQVRALETDSWTTLLDEPFELSESITLSEHTPQQLAQTRRPKMIEVALGLTSAPGARLELRRFGQEKRIGFWASADWLPDPETTTALLYNSSTESYSSSTSTLDSWTVAGGVAFRFGGR